MASRRMIASDIWRDEFISELDVFGRLLWVGLITTCADDQGRLPFKPRLIRSDIFPLDEIDFETVESTLRRFAEAGRILIYEAGGKSLIQILNWWRYQTPSWAAESKYEAPAGWVDRVKVHKGAGVFTENWGTPGGFLKSQGIATNLPIPVPTHLPTIQSTGLINGDGDGYGEIEQSETAPPPPPPPVERPNIFSVYEQEIGPITAIIAEELETAVSDFTEPWVQDAIHEAAVYGARSWAYCRSILQSRKAGRSKPRKGGAGYLPTGGGALTPEQAERGKKPALTAAQLAEFERAQQEQKLLLNRGGTDGKNQ